ncbi:hypothetical protein LEM8419_02044 [Neolewinella maritima]|uniref:PH domain-containing protein n=1 Tax=Neolewinella maritima TaxID=1383882 RepID=A0ABM9B1D2_9BACT|nr:hypothetical protein [Neolewinella maritima]CAH1001106.1 hypothetical protein LEM8419_02044 [Neolewinella maritima]
MPLSSAPSTSASLTYLRVDESDGTTRWSLPTPKHRYLLVGGTLWLIAWYFGLRGASSALGNIGFGKDGYAVLDGFLLFWLLLWLAGGVFVLGVLLWGYFGREVVTQSPTTLTLQRTVFGLGPKQAYSRQEVKNLRFRPVKTDVFSANSKWSVWGMGPGKVQFSYGGKSRSFGLGLPDEAALEVVEALSEGSSSGDVLEP